MCNPPPVAWSSSPICLVWSTQSSGSYQWIFQCWPRDVLLNITKHFLPRSVSVCVTLSHELPLGQPTSACQCIRGLFTILHFLRTSEADSCIATCDTSGRLSFFCLFFVISPCICLAPFAWFLIFRCEETAQNMSHVLYIYIYLYTYIYIYI